MPGSDRGRLSFLHEFGHWQTLPIALAHATVLLWVGMRRRRSSAGCIGWLLAAIVAHGATWELASKSFVVLSD
ncbi:MAG TPA: hypothetical protein VJ123_02725 [Anaerolineales bacterium]|nr:hypothetical protein [Anaerolineales bacterium]